MSSLERQLGSLEGKIDMILAHLEKGDSKFDALDDRIKKLEGWRWFVVGCSTAVSLLVGYIKNFKP